MVYTTGRAPTRTRAVLAVLMIVVAGAGIAVRAQVEGPIAKYGGVALWATLVYLLVLFVRPRSSPMYAGAVALGASFAIELLQLTPLPAFLSSQHVVLRMIFGTTFHLPDLPAYAAGVALGACTQQLLRRRHQSSRASEADLPRDR